MKKLAINGGIRAFEPGDFPLDEHNLDNQDIERIMGVLKSKRYSMFNNNTVEDLEHSLSEYFGVNRCAVVTNCTSALDSSLRALNIGEGDEVIMPSYTYAATMMAILSSGAKPVFVDIDYKTLTIDASAIEEKLNPKTKAMIPVHIFGNPSDMNAIGNLAKKHHIRILEDCAHSFGAMYDGKMTGTFDIGCHSFGENKILRIGEGGAVVSDDDQFMDRVEIIRHEGEVWSRTGTTASKGSNLKLIDIVGGIDYISRGHNFRYSPILAALGISRLHSIDDQIKSMNKNADRYTDLLTEIEGINIPETHNAAERIYSSYIALVESEVFDRDTFLLCLAMEGVPIGVHFPKPLHKTKIYETFSGDKNFPNSERFCRDHIALPIYPNITPHHVDKICHVINEVIEGIKREPKKIRDRAHELFPKINIENFYSGVYITV